MKNLEEVIELLRNIEVGSNGYRLGDHMEYEITWTKNLPCKIAKVTKTDYLFRDDKYKIYFRNNVNLKRLDKVCKDKGYYGKGCKEGFITRSNKNFIIGYFGEIFAKEDFISFTSEKKRKALEIINAYLKSK